MEKRQPTPMKIIDTTLREGEQTPGVYFDLSLKKQIVSGLAEVGVDEIEIGISSSENNDLEILAEYTRNSHPQQQFSLWCRCLGTDIDFRGFFASQLSFSVYSGI